MSTSPTGTGGIVGVGMNVADSLEVGLWVEVGATVGVGLVVEVRVKTCVAAVVGLEVGVRVNVGIDVAVGPEVGVRVDVGVAWQAARVNAKSIAAKRVKIFLFIGFLPFRVAE